MSEARRITVTGAMQLAGALAQAKRGVLTIESIESIEATGRNQWVVQVSPVVAVATENHGYHPVAKHQSRVQKGAFRAYERRFSI